MTETKARVRLGSPDWLLLGATAALVALGLMLVFSSTFDVGYRVHQDAAYYFKQQALWLGLGFVVLLISAQVHYRHWMKVSIVMLAGVLGLLMALKILGYSRFLLGQSVSPSEMAKLAVIVYIGHWLASKRVEQLRRLPVGLLPFTIIVGIVVGLVLAQPDISEAVLITLVAVAMFFLAGADWLQFGIGLVGGIGAFALVISRFPVAVERLQPFLVAWRDPLLSENPQLRRGVVAMGAGGIFGLGPGNGMTSYGWVPAVHTDSIFAMVGEELGLIGCLTVFGLYVVFVYRGLTIARRAPDAFGHLLALGITCWIAFQALINMAVVTGTIPFTGIALPFISKGGSSLVASLLGVGILTSISRVTNAQGEAIHETSGVRRGDRWARVPSPDSHRRPA